MIFKFIKNLSQKKFLNDLAFVYAGAVINGLSLFFINVVLGRFLEKDLFAVFSLSIMALSTVAEMSDFGLNAGLLRFAPHYIALKEENKLKQLVKIVWKWRIYISVFLTLLGIIFSYPLAKYIFGQPEIYKQVAFSFLGVGGVVLLGFANTFMQANQKFIANSIFQILKGVLRFLLVGFLILVGIKNIYIYLTIYLIVPWILFIPAFKFLPLGFKEVNLSKEEQLKIAKQIKNFSFWVALWSFASIFSSRVDQIFISKMLGLKDVANYYVAYQFVYLYSMASQAISSVLMPKINSIINKEELIKFVKRAYKWIGVGIICILPLIYPSKLIIIWLFGEKYFASMPLYLVLSFGMVVSFLSIPLGLIITYFNKTELYALSALINFGINLGFNYIFIIKFGLIGAAYAFVLGIVFSLSFNMICSVYLLRKRKLSIV